MYLTQTFYYDALTGILWTSENLNLNSYATLKFFLNYYSDYLAY